MPSLGQLRISEITTETIEQLVMDLSEKESHRGGPLSPTTVNQILASLKIIFSESVRLGRLAVDPTRTVEPLEERPRERSFLAPAEVRKLFNLRTIKKVWDGDRRQYTLNLLSASTGMRLGEVQALQNRFVFNGYVQVEHGWTRFGLKEPKRGSKRVIPLSSKTQLRLRELMQLSPYQDPEDLVFWGEARDRSLSQSYILDHLPIFLCPGLVSSQFGTVAISKTSFGAFTILIPPRAEKAALRSSSLMRGPQRQEKRALRLSLFSTVIDGAGEAGPRG
jgi:site-specific recombinase XerD